MNKRKRFPQTCELSVKRRRVQECPPSSQTPDQDAWDEIPYVVLLHIFKHLDSKSRCAAATVCKRWNFAFKNASLWRSVALTIGGLNAKHTAFKCIRFVKLFGPHLRELRISCQVLSYSNSLLITDTLHAMFLLLPESGLRVLVLDNLEADNHECWRYPRLAASLVTSLVNFVDSQRNLEQFSMKSAKLEEQNGIRLLQALGQPSASNLSSLDLEAFFGENVSVANCAAFKTALTTFSHVETLALNYWYLSDELMKQMALDFRRLKRLKVTCLWDSDNDAIPETISDVRWRSLKKSCPELGVCLTLSGCDSVDCTLLVLTKSIPLVSLTMTPEFYTARELHIILEFIAANFQDVLEDLDLDLELYVDGPTNYDFMLPVVTCQRLRRIKLKISNNLNAEIVNSLQQLTNVSTLKDVSIRFSDEEMSQELRTVLKEFGDNLKSALADRQGEFEFHLIPDLYELQ